MARLRTSLRHRLHEQGAPASFVTGDLMVDRVRLVQVKGTEVKLSPREYDILQLLVQHAGKVLTHQFIMREVWKVPTCSIREKRDHDGSERITGGRDRQRKVCS